MFTCKGCLTRGDYRFKLAVLPSGAGTKAFMYPAAGSQILAYVPAYAPSCEWFQIGERKKAYYVLFVALKHIGKYINTFCRKTQKLCTMYSLSQGGSVLNIFVSFRPFFQSKRVRDSKLCTAYPEFSKQPLHAGHAVITTSSNSVHLNPKQT